MKYGKEFQQILEDSHFPEDWKSSAIEYRRLKKLIKDVVAELSNMGLSPGVLNKLMVTEDDEVSSPPPLKAISDDSEVLEFEFESDESPPTRPTEVKGVPSGTAKAVIIDPILEDVPTVDQRGRRVSAFENNATAGPSSLPAETHHRKFRLRLLSDSPPQPSSPTPPRPLRPMGVMDMVRAQSQERKKGTEGEARRNSERTTTRVTRKATADQGGVKAEYVLVGDAESLVPQLRLHLHTSPVTSRDASPMPAPGESETDTTSDDGDDSQLDAEENKLGSPSQTPRIKRKRPSPPSSPHSFQGVPASPTLERVRTAISPIWALASGTNLSDGMQNLSLESPTHTTLPDASLAVVKSDNIPEISTSDREREREFIVPLASDMAFFNLLTAALTSLSNFHQAQQTAFRNAVENLCRQISSTIQPGSAPSVLPTPLTPSSSTSIIQHSSAKTSRKDLYAWREIFTLWIEFEIFESSSERNRGERTVDDAEARLKRFANEVVKRGLGDRRTMRGKKVRGAWDEFLRLNVLLLDLKRFQLANINAARKILKKHDKRTALTASAGFPNFVRSTLSSHVDKQGNVSTWTFYETSLPHVLLASLTDTLLPILPSLDDYACLICTSIAFKPVRLSCSHLFCVRCLVKMQRAGKAECPLCRSKVVLLADKDSLDHTVMKFMKEWFPKEVKEKQKENIDELAKEHAEAGIDARCVVM